jgi:hypothetical protein
MSTSNAAAQAAAQAAFHQFAIESWTLYAIGLSATVLRTYGRLRGGGVRNLRASDYLVWIGVVRAPIDPTAPLLLLIPSCAASLHSSGGSCVQRGQCCRRPGK